MVLRFDTLRKDQPGRQARIQACLQSLHQQEKRK
jgi:hypothetical protein